MLDKLMRLPIHSGDNQLTVDQSGVLIDNDSGNQETVREHLLNLWEQNANDAGGRIIIDTRLIGCGFRHDLLGIDAPNQRYKLHIIITNQDARGYMQDVSSTGVYGPSIQAIMAYIEGLASHCWGGNA